MRLRESYSNRNGRVDVIGPSDVRTIANQDLRVTEHREALKLWPLIDHNTTSNTIRLLSTTHL